MLIYLIRHGETDWNGEKRIMGRSPIPLNDTGREQVKLLASALKGEGITAIYTSDVARAKETASILAWEWVAAVVEEPRLDESTFDTWVGKTHEELRSDPDFKLYHTKPTRSRFSAGEGMADIQKRAIAAVARAIDEAKSEKVALVSHRDVIKPIIVQYLGIDLDAMHVLSLSTASATLLDLRGGRTRLRYINMAPWRWQEKNLLTEAKRLE
jgi:probable phosphoglycerate mutase